MGSLGNLDWSISEHSLSYATSKATSKSCQLIMASPYFSLILHEGYMLAVVALFHIPGYLQISPIYTLLLLERRLYTSVGIREEGDIYEQYMVQ